MFRDPAGDAFARFQPHPSHFMRMWSFGGGENQIVGRKIPQEKKTRIGIGQATDQLHRFIERVVQLERGGEQVGKVREHFQFINIFIFVFGGAAFCRSHGRAL